MKTQILKSFVLSAISLLLFTANSSAVGTLRNSMPKMNISIETLEADTNNAEILISTSEAETELASIPSSVIENTIEHEEDLEIEEWMTDETSFRFNQKVEENSDLQKTMEIEPWMTNHQLWIH